MSGNHEELTPEEIEQLYDMEDKAAKQAALLKRFRERAFFLRQVELAVQLVIRFRDDPRRGPWALDLLERAYADETDPENDPEDWEPPP